MQNIRPFQILLLGVFTILAVVSVIVLAGVDVTGSKTVNSYGNKVEIWGSLNPKAFEEVFSDISKIDKEFSVVKYRYIDERTFEDVLVNAIAENRAPDVILMPHDQLVTYRPKLQPLSYEVLSQRDFKDSYIDGAEIFARPDGVYAIPFGVDPLVMYWNRDMFAAQGLANPPATWEVLVSDSVMAITQHDISRNLLKSTVAFGEYRNVLHAKELLLSLAMQSGSRLIEEGDDGYLVSVDVPLSKNARKPLHTAVQFYVNFSNPNSERYSWNRAWSDDLTTFLGENLALYFGYGSEVFRIREQNPNFNFDVAPIPQGAGASVKRVYGTFYGFAILSSSDNQNGSFRAIQMINNPASAQVLAEKLSLAPVQRALIAEGSSDPYRQILLDAALVARGWLDPDPAGSDGILQDMIEDIVSNRKKITNAVDDAVQKLKLIF